MPIRIDYTPVPALLSLARAAGEAERRQRTEAGDIAFTQMVLGAQVQYTRMGLEAQARDRAFALQQAEATARIARTSMARAELRAPVADHVLARKRFDVEQRGMQREQIISQAEDMQQQGLISKADLERIKLGTMADYPSLYRDISARPEVSAVKRIEKRTQDDIRRRITREERKLKVDPYADPSEQKLRIEMARNEVSKLEKELKASYAREDVALLGTTPTKPQMTVAQENALMDAYLAETKGDVQAAIQLMTEREGR